MVRWSWFGLSWKPSKLARVQRDQRRGKPGGGRRRPGLEQLEDRRVPAGLNPNELVDTSLSPAQLAQSLVGPGVEISNVRFTGGNGSTGKFNFADPTVLGFDQGIILASGNAADVVGPNVSDWYSTDFSLPGDPDLDALSGYTTFDAAVLEFDFVPSANQVVFQYVFASDEYPEYVNTVFNDVFAFFVNGTNYAQVRQVAGDPTSPFVPVAVNNINNSNPVQSPPPVAMRPDLFRANYNTFPNPSAIDLELDGITRILTFQAPVVPGQLNHMKLAIADASDGIFDSAVFIQSGSLVSNENPVADLSLSPSSGIAPLDVTAIIEGEDPNGLPLTYDIDWGDGTHSSGPLEEPTNDSEKTALAYHTYTTGGSYIVTLTVSNGTLFGTSSEDVDVTSVPAAPVVTQNPTDQSVLEGDVFSLTAAATGFPAPSVQWQVSIDGGLTFTDIDGATETTYTATAFLSDDGNLYQAVFTNSEGSVTTTAALLKVVPQDTTPPAAPGVALAHDTGLSPTDKVTQDGTLTLSGLEDGATVEYSIDSGNTWTGNFAAVEGPNTVAVRQVDAAGNASDPTVFSFTRDTTMPAAPGVALAHDTGRSSSDLITRDATLALSGQEADALVEYSADGTNWGASYGATEGLNTAWARQTDVAGNVSDVTVLSFTWDTTAPTLAPTFSAPPPFLVGATGIAIAVNGHDETGLDSESNSGLDTSSAGRKVVTCTATDLAGNSASVDMPYIVGYRALNLAPLAGATFKPTATIPVSFQLADANGVISDQAAASLVPDISVSFDGLPAVGVKYNKKSNSFSATLKTGRPAAGAHVITLRVTVGGVDVTKETITITIA